MNDGAFDWAIKLPSCPGSFNLDLEKSIYLPIINYLVAVHWGFGPWRWVF